MKRFYSLAIAVVMGATAMVQAQIPAGYYDGLKGLKGEALKTALIKVSRPKSMPGYGSGNGKTWYYFWETDRMPDGKTWRNRYSDATFPVGTRGSAAAGMNIEHSFPRSWFGGNSAVPDTDLFNLYPSDSKTNGSKSNYIMDTVKDVNTSKSDGYTKIGTSTHTSETWCWEPNDDYKGDYARGYMYMITAWKNDVTFTSRAVKSNDYPGFMDNNMYPGFFKWAGDLYSQWARNDRPDQIEIDRNNAIYKIQGNRNPFIDFPNLFEYLWGDSTAYAFDPSKTVIAGSDGYNPGGGGGGGTTEPEEPGIDFESLDQIYLADFLTGECGVKESVSQAAEGKTSVWNLSATYGWVANAYDAATQTRAVTDATLTTSDIDLTGCKSAYVQIDHAVNFLANPTDMLSVTVDSDYGSEDLEGMVWPAGNSWTFMKTGAIDLSAFVGVKVRLSFRYRSSADRCGAWEIKSVEVRGEKSASGIADINADGFDPAAPIELYHIDGRRADASSRGLLIMRQGSRATKVVR